jgi:hypothetical protein
MSENLLARETSPYLLQHKDNPVHWRPWGPAALAEAERAGKPILLSVGYAACHWCHVMAHESFEDPATAAVMNELFVNIKVDREERPDIDQIYMHALHALGEQGGWPLTMFLTPKGEPIWGGTYFPTKPVSAGRLSRAARGRPRLREERRRSAKPILHQAQLAVPAGDAILDAAPRSGPEPCPTCGPENGGTRARRNFRSTFSFCGALAPCHMLSRHVRSIAKAASTTISPAASRATASMRAGSCRISRRCSTTTRSSSA